MIAPKTDVIFNRIKDLDQNQDVAIALGNMVIAWSYAEQALMNVLARITDIPLNVILAAYYRIPTINSRMQFLQGLLSGWKSDKFNREAISAEIDGLNKLSSTRNHWIHNEWCRGTPGGEIVQFDQRAAIDSPNRKKSIKAADIKNHNDAVLKRCAAIDVLIDEPTLRIDW